MTRISFFAFAISLGCTPVVCECYTPDSTLDTAEDTAIEVVAFEILSVTVEHGSALRVVVKTSTPATEAGLAIQGSVDETWALSDVEGGDPCASPEQGDGTRWGLCAIDSAWAPVLQEVGVGKVTATGADGEVVEVQVEI